MPTNNFGDNWLTDEEQDFWGVDSNGEPLQIQHKSERQLDNEYYLKRERVIQPVRPKNRRVFNFGGYLFLAVICYGAVGSLVDGGFLPEGIHGDGGDFFLAAIFALFIWIPMRIQEDRSL